MNVNAEEARIVQVLMEDNNKPKEKRIPFYRFSPFLGGYPGRSS